MDWLDNPKLPIVILSFEESLRRMFEELLNLEGYPTEVVRTAAQALNACERASTCVVVMDNYHVSNEAQAFARTLFSRPGLHARVKLVGMAAMRSEHLVDLDAFIRLPPTVEQFLEPVARLCGELVASQ